MFGGDFGKKCIIVHFLGTEKDGKALNAEFAEAQRKDLRKIRREKTHPRTGRPPRNQETHVGNFSVKSFISAHINHRSP
jgi:hypothetical protein